MRSPAVEDGDEVSQWRDPKPGSYLDVLKNEVLGYLDKRQKIQAVKFVKDSTGWDLAKSKEYVESLED